MSADITIEGETWSYKLTADEYAAWDKYADSHAWLFSHGSYEGILRMFLSHLRIGCDLNAVFERNRRSSCEQPRNLTNSGAFLCPDVNLIHLANNRKPQ